MKRKYFLSTAALGALLALTAGCRDSRQENSPPRSAWFEDGTAARGLNFVHDPGALGRFFMPESVGSGAALFDYDNDGRLDVFLLQNAGPNSKSTNRLFHQGADGKFTDATAGSGLGVAGYGMGVAAGDINNDGLPDLLVTEYAGVRLFLNNGKGNFTDITAEAGVANPHWATSAAFFDYDRDGWLDLVVVNYIDYLEKQKCYDRAGNPDYCGPNSIQGTVSKLFHNLGAAGGAKTARFEDVTVKSGLGDLPGPGLGVVCADFDGDGWADLLIANDAKPNGLWMNRHDGTFKNEAAQRGIAYNALGAAQANMGIALGDINGDGLFDIYITHLSEENNILWTQGPAGLFQDRTATAGLANTAWHATGFGTVFADFDNDGALDLALANGRVRRSGKTDGPVKLVPALGAHWSAYAERNQIFANDGAGNFRDVSERNPALCGMPNVARGVCVGDLDNDGALDLLITRIAAPPKLLRNTAPDRGHWLTIRAIDPALGGRDAYGAQVSVVAGGRRRVAWLNPGYSFACSNDPRVHFGLGKNLRAVEAVQILWPDGALEDFPGAAADQVLTLRKGAGHPAVR